MKFNTAHSRIIVATLFLQLCLVGSACAQATRTWVSGTGDDANPCSRTAPCKTYAGAISKTASGGEISTLDPGGYGGLTITKSITLSGDGTLASVLVSGTPGITVNAGASDVIIIRNLSINGIGAGTHGINFVAGGSLHVENVKIYGFNNNGIMFAPNGAASLFVSETSIRDNVGIGIAIQPTGGGGYANATIDRATVQANGQGIRAEDGSTVVISKTIASGNLGNGFTAAGASRSVDMSITDSVASNNGLVGVYAGNMGTVKISNITSTRNYVGLLIAGGNIVSFRNNTVFGNTGAEGAPNFSFPQM